MSRSINVREYEELEIPKELLTEDVEIRALPSVLQKDYFSVRYKKGKAVLQAGGCVGVVPVNADLVLNISPKVPISNLERIVFLANHQPSVLAGFRRRYSPHQFSSNSLAELLGDFFILAVEDVCSTGLLKLYKEVASVGFSPRGRIDVHATLRQRARSHDLRISSIAHYRYVDVAPNQLIKFVLLLLLRDKKLAADRARRRRVVELLNHFESVSMVECLAELATDPMVANASSAMPSTKQSYLSAIALALVLAGGKGVAFLGAGEIEGGSLVLNLEKAFEGYVLALLLRSAALRAGEICVLDGNKGGDMGGKQVLFTSSAHPGYIKRDVVATPDIVVRCEDVGSRCMVIEVKYKSVSGIADRSDINQIIAYAFSYGAFAGMLVLPRSEQSGSGLLSMGLISGVEFFLYFLDVGASSLEAEEEMFAEVVAELMRQ